MKRGAACLTAAAMLNLASIGLRAAPEDAAAVLGQSVRLDHRSVGCGTPDALMRIAVIQVSRGDQAMIDRLQDEDCRVFSTFHGEVTDRQGDMLCVLGLGNGRCLWFVRTAFVPARPL